MKFSDEPGPIRRIDNETTNQYGRRREEETECIKKKKTSNSFRGKFKPFDFCLQPCPCISASQTNKKEEKSQCLKERKKPVNF